MAEDLLTPEERDHLKRIVPEGVRSLEGFIDSLRILVEVERYSLMDIAAMFGVTRERIRQICKIADIATPGHSGKGGLFHQRLWIDAENRFAPVKKAEIRLGAQMTKHHLRNKEREAEVERRRTLVVSAAQSIRESGKRVTIKAIAERIFGEGIPDNHTAPRLRSFWYFGGRGTGPMAPIREACGMTVSTRGWAKGEE
jgi:hypothetical protein